MKSAPMKRRPWLMCLAPALLAFSVAQAAEGSPGVSATQPDSAAIHAQVFATVNGQQISSQEFESAFVTLVRQKFYHGQVPEGQLLLARDEVKNKLIQRILLLEEASRRGIVPDDKKVEETLAGYESRYANSPAWKESRERLLPELKKQLGEQSLLARLEQSVRQMPDPSEAEARAYYDAHPELFTEPEKLRLSAILLKVDPSSPSTAWEATRLEAKSIYERLMAGADFGETSRLHSNMNNADQGGDLGYLHRGMLPEVLQGRIDSFELGKLNEPIDTLDGVAIFRLDDRIPPKKREFADVRQRAADLLTRERQDKAWKDLLEKLTASADIKIHSQLGAGHRDGNGS